MRALRKKYLFFVPAGAFFALLLFCCNPSSSSDGGDAGPAVVLSGLTLSEGTLTPAFSSDVTSYTASVPNSVSSIVVTPSVADPDLAVTVDGTKVLPGAGSATVVLEAGVAKDIADEVSFAATTKTYTVTVTRDLPAVVLSGISLSVGTLSPSFAAGKTSYTASVGSSTPSLTVTASAADPSLTVKANGTIIPLSSSGSEDSGTSAPIAIVTGNNVIGITVSDGTETTPYTVTVTRPAAPVLNTLSIYNVDGENTISTTPPFSSGTTSYAAEDYLPATVRVTPTASTGTIKVNGTIVASGNYVMIPYELSGTYDIVVEVSDGSTTTIYTVTLDLIGS